MKTGIIYRKEIKLYEYQDLSPQAKEVVKEWYTDDKCRSDILYDDLLHSYLYYFFPHSSLDVQFDFSCTQGSGLNIYGTLDWIDMKNYLKNYNPEEHNGKKLIYDWNFSEKQEKRLDHYMSIATLSLDRNMRYTFCMVQRDEHFSENIYWPLEQECYKNIDYDLINEISLIMSNAIISLCNEMYDYGYEYLLEPSDDEIQEACGVNEWYFDKDGKFISWKMYDEVI